MVAVGVALGSAKMFELRKIGIVRRVSAWLLDAILLAVLTTGFMFLVSLTCNYEHEESLAMRYNAEWDDFRKEYVGDVATYYGFDYKETDDGYEITKAGEKSSLDALMQTLVNSKGKDDATKAAYDAYNALTPASEVVRQNELINNLLLIMVSVGVLLAYIVLEFVLPIIFKNGQTVGKKVFGICLVRSDCVKITTMALFARTVLGKFAIETMFPVLLVFLFLFGGFGIIAVVLLAVLALVNIILFFATKNKTPIHDLVAGTVAVDMRLQMIFQTVEELNQKKALAQREIVGQTPN